MSADDDRQRFIPLAEVPNLPWLPRRVHVGTVHRWTTAGRKGRVLRTVNWVGGKATADEWVWEFLTGNSRLGATAVRTQTQRQRAIARAEATLDAAGV